MDNRRLTIKLRHDKHKQQMNLILQQHINHVYYVIDISYT